MVSNLDQMSQVLQVWLQYLLWMFFVMFVLYKYIPRLMPFYLKNPWNSMNYDNTLGMILLYLFSFMICLILLKMSNIFVQFFLILSSAYMTYSSKSLLKEKYNSLLWYFLSVWLPILFWFLLFQNIWLLYPILIASTLLYTFISK